MRFYIETFGCQMNKLDSEVLSGLLEGAGLSPSDSPEDADVVLVNTCSVREHAEQRVLERLRRLARWKRERPGRILGVVGCMAQRMGWELLTDVPHLDLVAGPDSYNKLPDVLERRDLPVALVEQDGELYEGVEPRREGGVRAWVAIMRGCDNFCSYCIVPYVRGRERSRPHRSVVAEVEELARESYKDVTLLGQNVNSYCDGEVDFAGLLRLVDRAGVPRVRFLTSHPKDLSEEVLRAMAECPSLCEHLHLPIQSGSDRVLQLMRRSYTVERYIRIVEEARGLILDISITTDILVGFPGETEEDFERTLEVIRYVQFDDAYMYRYSPRPGTLAAQFPDDVPEEEKLRRLDEVIRLQREITWRVNERLVGSEVEVLIEAPAKRDGMLGRTRTDKPVVVRGEGLKVGDFVKVRVTGTTGPTLLGGETALP
ncbi:MAG TPA: tRNA (N6-isopentenyl adenosine(37)-C2)-methylthiotransferase MiaB [Candidatus Latescibacteria bacterium]|nr:tRNA (N6-isopentenyl adenosine(37)-C2)-methylthiotransferase MiaB [Candidatus Latescibacterota bacterium]